MGQEIDGAGDSSPTSLEPPETKSDPHSGIRLQTEYRPSAEFGSTPALIGESIFRHTGWRHRRLKVWEAMHRLHLTVSRLDRFSECGSALWLRGDPKSGTLSLASNGCHDRWCEACSREKAAVIAENVFVLLQEGRRLFVTLTLKHSLTPLKDQLDRLLASFNRLRERRWWEDRVKGGAAFIEIKVGERSGLWHPHLHLVVDASWLDQRELSQEWLKVTGDSSIVDVRLVKDFGHVAHYVAKYVAKAASHEVFASPAMLDEMITALKGRRLCTTFGAWRGQKLSEVPPSDVEWRMIGSVDALFDRARKGESIALAFVALMTEKWPSLADAFGAVKPP